MTRDIRGWGQGGGDLPVLVGMSCFGQWMDRPLRTPACLPLVWATRSAGEEPLVFIVSLGGRLTLKNGPTAKPLILSWPEHRDSLWDRR